jgi:DNA invertase Pin-like site-specific DNA recombinase
VLGQVFIVSGQVVGYVRVSAADQNPQRQLEVLGECHKVFTDKISGKSRAKRQALADLIGYIRDGDTVRIASMDRLGRDTRDLYNIVAEITDKGAAVQFINENITVDKNGASPMDSLMLGILAAFAEFERRRIRERQAEGIAIAKAKGKYAQQPALSEKDVEQVKALVDIGYPKTEIARQFQVSRQTIYNALKRT